MSEWVSTERVEGEVVFNGGHTLKGNLHLQVSTAIHGSVETPLEMLNRPEAFFPLTLPGGDVCLVSKDIVTAASFGRAAPEPRRLPVTEPSCFEVHMTDGSEYHGAVHVELKPPRTRGLDLLNQPERFFVLTMPEQTWYLNRSQVQHVRHQD